MAGRVERCANASARRARRSLLAIAPAVLAFSVLVVVPAGAATPPLGPGAVAPGTRLPAPGPLRDPSVARSMCADPVRRAVAAGTTVSSLSRGVVSILGHEATVAVGPISLVTPPRAFADPTRAQVWRSLAWAAPAYATPGADPVPWLTRALDDALRSYHDPGSATAARLARALATGWDEATVTQREIALDCFAAATGDPVLVAALDETVRANLDVRRYYGPPMHKVHNHGTQANLALLDSALVLRRPSLTSVALARLDAELPEVFDASGFTREQSSSYQIGNLELWKQVRSRLAGRVAAAKLRDLDTRLRAARAVAAHLAGPDGRLVRIGDGWVDAGPPSVVGQRLTLTDPAGLVVGRWSWTDPRTTWFTQRLGPPRRAHGHRDATSFTWSTLGSPVVVDPGSYCYDGSSAFWRWQSSPAAANLAVADGSAVVDRGSRLISRTRTGTTDTTVVTSDLFDRRVTRRLAVDAAHRSVTVTDSSSGALTEHLHLAAGWVLSGRDAHSLRFSRGDLRLLVVLAAGSSIATVTGAMSPVRGWVFDGPIEHATPAPEILARGSGTVRLRLVVTRAVAP